MNKQYNVNTAAGKGADSHESVVTINFGDDNVSDWLADLAAKTIIISLQSQWRNAIRKDKITPPKEITVKAEDFKPRTPVNKVEKAKKLGLSKEQVMALLKDMEE